LWLAKGMGNEGQLRRDAQHSTNPEEERSSLPAEYKHSPKSTPSEQLSNSLVAVSGLQSPVVQGRARKIGHLQIDGIDLYRARVSEQTTSIRLPRQGGPKTRSRTPHDGIASQVLTPRHGQWPVQHAATQPRCLPQQQVGRCRMATWVCLRAFEYEKLCCEKETMGQTERPKDRKTGMIIDIIQSLC
jgi:hypothetical protein